VTKPKVKVEVEKPVFCVVEQTKHTTLDRYRVVIFSKVKDKTITIDTNPVKVSYSLVESESEKPSINAQYFRDWCAKRNAEHRREQGIKTEAERIQSEQERQRTWQANAAKREQERIQARQARHQERKDGAQQARPILREIAIRKRMMDEVETGQQALPKNLRSVI